ncbi:hypothetical protein AAFC00_006638 [Neodothiora populina]|uniref:Glutamine synthetase n=1 Tax=Neodothiora populina TaxID=2781224 RepID=A0ABR3PAM4_9PEZI
MSINNVTVDDLKFVVQSCPAIDNHAHNLLLPSQESKYSLLNAATEASGDALRDAPTSLPHLRMLRHLRELYGCDETAGWKQLMAKRHELLAADAPAFFRKCFEGIHMILMEDGLDGDEVHPYAWHNQFTPGGTSRIVRIETVAADLLRGMWESDRLDITAAIEDDEVCGEIWITFLRAFEKVIADFIQDVDVAGFKSVICYRTGLNVHVGSDVEVATRGLDAFRDDFLADCDTDNPTFRIASKGLNDCLLISTCRLLTAANEQNGIMKPLQFHTGLGDNDMSIIRSNPAHMQPLIQRFPEVRFVLLHSSYPYTREAGYLATVYSNVFLDLGEVFPMVSRDGQEHIIRQAMEMTPTTKLLYSTDAHHFAEGYWLANKQFRQALEKVLVDYVECGDLTINQAINVAKDVLFNNSNDLYELDLDLPDLAVPKKNTLQLAWQDNTSVSAVPVVAMSSSGTNDLQLLNDFESKHDDHQFACVQWLDYMSTLRARIFPWAEFRKLVEDGQGFSIALGNIGTLQNDTITSAVSMQGDILVKPDLESLRAAYRKKLLATASVIASFKDDTGNLLPTCPRSILQRIVDRIAVENNLQLLLGFEIEFVFLRSNTADNDRSFEPSETNHAWGTLTPEQCGTTLPILAEIVAGLLRMGIAVRHFHSESGPGQYEIALAPLPPVAAIDALVQARQVLQQIACAHGLKATMHPVPFNSVGSGQHVHVSMHSFPPNTDSDTTETQASSFLSSILSHLPSICAFSLPNNISYSRVRANHWTGGTYVAYGYQNRETPLRTITPNSHTHFELRCMDGFANPYLALGALLGAGLLGVQHETQLTMSDCRDNPADISDSQRGELGIREELPSDLETALSRLDADDELCEVLGREMVAAYIDMKRAEREMLEGMGMEASRIWLLERY